MLWPLLCRTFIIIVIFRRIFWLLGVIYDFLILRKTPPEVKKPRFPFLKLHYVAIREVLKALDPLDHVNFSKASKSCRRLSTIRKPYTVKLTFANRPLITFCNGPIEYVVKWTVFREKDGNRVFWKQYSVDNLYKYSENSLDAVNELKEYHLYVKSLMSVEIDTVEWQMSYFNGLCRKDVDWLRANAPEFPALSVLGTNQRQEDLEYILDNLKFTKSLKINVNVIEPRPLRIPDTLEELRISYGSWITLDYIMSLKMRRLAFRGTYLTNQDINVFFKSWLEMKSHHDLERFETNLTNREDFIAIGLRDIPYRMGSMRHLPGWSYISVQGSFEVTRNDGLTASVCTYLCVSGFTVIMYTRLSDLNQ
ncbi:hypothetical protein B9Z55_002771 [Caenorhabditis nigoni]|uniref:Uncharacterized protein n=1 Tax=Caenorhabditis nigoni TaxID=1611254 RepID=A0A2G5VM13_9PELO|nr:hypothetical protein B9Z55_002771 [Caenorhabditis nigoni]